SVSILLVYSLKLIPTIRLSRQSMYTCPTSATTMIYTLSLHDALPIYRFHNRDTGGTDMISARGAVRFTPNDRWTIDAAVTMSEQDRKSTRLNSSHVKISYAVFCLKKKTTHKYYWHVNP